MNKANFMTNKLDFTFFFLNIYIYIYIRKENIMKEHNKLSQLGTFHFLGVSKLES